MIKLCLILEAFLWISSADGQEVYMIVKCLQIPQSPWNEEWCSSSNFPNVSFRARKRPKLCYWRPCIPSDTILDEKYDHCSNNEQVVFNNKLRSARNPIECALGRLTARWGKLTKKMDVNLETIPVAIYECFVLRNICERNNSYIGEELVKSQIERIKENSKTYHNIPDPVFLYNGGEGQVPWNILTSFMCEFFWKKNNKKDKNIL